jgi:hypothetical protein
MFKKFMSIAALFFAASFAANSAVVTVQSSDIANPFTVDDLAVHWSGLDSNLITLELANGSLPTASLFNGSSNNNTLYKLTATFTETEASVVNFFAGLDAGWGAEVFVNGTSAFDTTDDLWWNNNWNNANEVISILGINFASGVNIIEVYWAEGQNSGGNSFKADVKVSAPTILSIFALGLAGLAFTRKK